MTEDSDNLTIVSTIIALAHSLNLKVIAEGWKRKSIAVIEAAQM